MPLPGSVPQLHRCNQRTSVLITGDGSQPEGGGHDAECASTTGAPDRMLRPAGQQLAREQAIKQIQRKRRFWTGAAWSGIGMIILVIIWALTEYHNAGGWPTSGFSQSSVFSTTCGTSGSSTRSAAPWARCSWLRAHWSVYRPRTITESQIKREIERQNRA